MAQIFQHATGYEIVNNYDYYGLSEDIMFEIKQQVIQIDKICPTIGMTIILVQENILLRGMMVPQPEQKKHFYIYDYCL